MNDAGDSVPRRLAEALIGVASWDRGRIDVGAAAPGLLIDPGDGFTVLGSIARAHGATTVFASVHAPDVARQRLHAALASSGFERLAFGTGDLAGFVSAEEQDLGLHFTRGDVAIGVQAAGDPWGTIALVHVQQGEQVLQMKRHGAIPRDEVPMPRLELPSGTRTKGSGRSGAGDRGSVATIRFSPRDASVDAIHMALAAQLPAQGWTELARTGAASVAVSCHSHVDKKGARWSGVLTVVEGEPWLASMQVVPITKGEGGGSAYHIESDVVSM